MDLRSELAEALELLGLFEIYDSVPDDHGYVGSGLEKRVTEFRRRHGHPSINDPALHVHEGLRQLLRKSIEPALGLAPPAE
jgi:hypothetical protein